MKHIASLLGGLLLVGTAYATDVPSYTGKDGHQHGSDRHGHGHVVKGVKVICPGETYTTSAVMHMEANRVYLFRHHATQQIMKVSDSECRLEPLVPPTEEKKGE